MIVLGLTGSIGMGKSTTASMFRDEGVPVNDADANVHALYAGPAAAEIEAAFPGTVENGVVNRQKLSTALAGNPAGFKTLEAIIHPKVRAMEQDFLAHHQARGTRLVVLDIPLLFETGGESRVDRIAVVSCEPDIQRERVLARPGMTEEKYAMILSRQLPDVDKRARADFIIDTGRGLDHARQEVRRIIEELTG